MGEVTALARPLHRFTQANGLKLDYFRTIVRPVYPVNSDESNPTLLCVEDMRPFWQNACIHKRMNSEHRLIFCHNSDAHNRARLQLRYGQKTCFACQKFQGMLW